MRTDDLRWMPQTRRLIGGAGLSFANSFAPNPLCCPSRASFLTGQYSHTHGVLSHQEPYGFGVFDDSDTLATRLQETGYRTGLVGKYLNGYGVQPTLDGADSLTYVPPGWTQWWAGSDHAWSPGDPFAGGTYAYFSLTSNVNGEIRSWPGEYSTTVMGRQTRDLIDRFSADRKPWFVWWNPVAPHHGGPIEPDDPGTTLRADGFPVRWVTPARPEAVKGRFDEAIPRASGQPPAGSPEQDRTDKPAYLRNLPELTDAERAAQTEVTRQRAESLAVLDDEVAATVAALRRSGELKRTVVVFTSDNGYYLGEHLKRQGKINLHEPSIRVPLLIRGPGVPRGTRYDPATTIDLSRTLAAWAGIELASPAGVDLRPVIADGDRGWSRPVVLEGLMPEWRYLRALGRPAWRSDLTTLGLRLGRWKVIRYATGETELYDLRTDPLELDSLSLRQLPDTPVARALDLALRRYAGCSGAACRVDVPPLLALPPEENEAITRAQARAVREYYGW